MYFKIYILYLYTHINIESCLMVLNRQVGYPLTCFFYLFISMELTWKQFVNQNHIRTLPLNEQVRQYSFHLDSISNQRFVQNKGPRQSRLQITGFLLQEDLFLIQQEDGSGIYITSYA